MKHQELRVFWRNHIESCQRSNQSAARYCRSNHLKYASFIRWRNRFKEKTIQTSSPGFVRVIEDNRPVALQKYQVSPLTTLQDSAIVEIGETMRIKLPPMSVSDLAVMIASFRECKL